MKNKKIRKTRKHSKTKRKLKHKGNIFLETLYVSIFSLFLYWVFGLIFGHILNGFDKLSPLTNKIEDFELSDLSFSRVHETEDSPDSNIVIVNCSNDSKSTIANKISRIMLMEPKAIGIDVLFTEKCINSDCDSLASVIYKNREKIILVQDSTFIYKDEADNYPFYKELMRIDSGKTGTYNFGYIVMEDDLKTKRTFDPYPQNSNKETDTSFAVKIIQTAFGKDSLIKLNTRKNTSEIINYRRETGNRGRYIVYDSIPAEATKIRDKIVLFGGYATNYSDDKYYTPMNGSFGKSTPDMFGVEYHAQILSMLIAGDFINEVPFKIVLIFILCYWMTLWYIKLFNKNEGLYELKRHFLLIFVSSILFIVACLLLEINIKFEPTEYIYPMYACGLLIHLYYWCLKQKPIIYTQKIIFKSL